MNISDLHGIDISSYQRGMNAASLNSVDFAILKVGEGATWTDPEFNNFYNAAEIPLGAYYYSRATTEAAAIAEAKRALELVGGRKLPLGIFMDVEEPSQLALRDSVLTSVVKAFCDTIKDGGYRAGAYGSAGNLWAKVGPSYLGDDVLVWVAQWGGRPKMGDLWQFSCTDRVSGYNGNVDGDKVLSERFAQLVAELPTPEPTPQPSPDPVPKDGTCSVNLTLPRVKFGDKGLIVKIIQTAIIGKGFSCGWMGADGIFGQQTKIALYQFKKKHGIESSEVYCDAATYKLLLEE